MFGEKIKINKDYQYNKNNNKKTSRMDMEGNRKRKILAIRKVKILTLA